MRFVPLAYSDMPHDTDYPYHVAYPSLLGNDFQPLSWSLCRTHTCGTDSLLKTDMNVLHPRDVLWSGYKSRCNHSHVKIGPTRYVYTGSYDETVQNIGKIYYIFQLNCVPFVYN